MNTNGFCRQVVFIAIVAGAATTAPADAHALQRTGDLRGRIVEARSHRPLAGIEVSVVTVNFSARTNERGEYSITNIPAGRYTLLVRGRGFKPAIAAQHMLLSDTVNVLDFELDRTPIEREAPPVSPEDDAKRATFAVDILTPDDLPENQDLVQALRGKVPGLNIERPASGLGADRAQRGVSLRTPGRQVLWVIDGTVITPPLNFDLNTSQVACVEIRRGASSAQRFARSIRTTSASRGYSGVILVWTHASRADLPDAC